MSNKLFQVSYITENIEQYATDMMLSALDQHPSDVEHLKPGSIDQRAEREVRNMFLFVSLFPFHVLFYTFQNLSCSQ